MKIYLSIISVLTIAINSFAQDCTEFKTHYESIVNTHYPGYLKDRNDTIINANQAFVDYTIQNLLDQSSDKCFISNRALLKRLKIVSCNDSEVFIEDQLQNGLSCKIHVRTSEFQVSKHTIETNKDSSDIKTIDGNHPFGGQYSIPKREINTIEIEINGMKLNIPNEAYRNLFNPLMCDNYGFYRQIEAYESLNGKYIYLYIYGGNAAGTYFSKLIFDHQEYKTKIISDYFPLSINGSFRESFIGF